MYQAIGVIELKSLAQGVSATDAALKSAGVSLVTAHPSCPGKYEIMLTGTIADVNATIDDIPRQNLVQSKASCCIKIGVNTGPFKPTYPLIIIEIFVPSI